MCGAWREHHGMKMDTILLEQQYKQKKKRKLSGKCETYRKHLTHKIQLLLRKYSCEKQIFLRIEMRPRSETKSFLSIVGSPE